MSPKRAHPKKGNFDPIPIREHSRVHSILITLNLEHNPSKSHCKKSTFHRGRKGIFESFSKNIFKLSVYKDENSQIMKILYVNDHIW